MNLPSILVRARIACLCFVTANTAISQDMSDIGDR